MAVREIRSVLAGGVRIPARGEGHSTAGQLQPPGGVVVDMWSSSPALEVTLSHVVDEARAHWSSIVAAPLPSRITGSFLSAENISADGIAARSRAGIMTELELLRPDGVIEIDRAEDRFSDLVRGGYADHGTIPRTKIQSVPVPPGIQSVPPARSGSPNWTVPAMEDLAYLDSLGGPTTDARVYPFDTTMISTTSAALSASPAASAAFNRMLAANAEPRQRTLDAGGTTYSDVSHRHGGGTRWL